jgi:hypothetical protein
VLIPPGVILVESWQHNEQGGFPMEKQIFQWKICLVVELENVKKSVSSY